MHVPSMQLFVTEMEILYFSKEEDIGSTEILISLPLTDLLVAGTDCGASQAASMHLSPTIPEDLQRRIFSKA